MFGLPSAEWALIENLCVRPLKAQGAVVYLFGSRARGDQRRYSDIDLTFESSNALPTGFLADVREKLEESRLSVKVDLVEWNDLAESYRERAARERVLV